MSENVLKQRKLKRHKSVTSETEIENNVIIVFIILNNCFK